MTYISINKANTNHKSRDDNGREIATYSRYETGVIAGKNREVLAVIADQAGFDGIGFDASIGSGDDSWHVANVFNRDRRYIDTMVIGGAFDSLHAKQVADSQLHRLRADNCVVVSNPQFDSLSDGKPDTWSIDAINKLLANPSQSKGFLPFITAQELNAEAARVTFDAVQWDSMDGLVSHNGKESALFLDLVRADGHKQLLTPLNLARELELLGAEEGTFDALMDTKNRLSLMKDRLFNAMSRNGDAELSVTSVTETKPFKRQGVTNIAFVFDLSDGQKLSIWFHNPDSTPSQLKADDVMISWKWMLNKRDVTAVLSPKQGDNVQLPVLAARIMRVARKNSKKFAAAQARAADLEKELLAAQTLVEVKQGEIDQLDTDIAGLNADIDAAMKASKVVEPPVNEVFADDSVPMATAQAADNEDDADEPAYTQDDVVDGKVYKTMGAAKANMTKNKLDKRRFEIVEIAGGGFGIKANPLDRDVLRPQIFALIDEAVAAYPDAENVTMITNRSGFDLLGKIVDLTDARIEELERENIITRAEIKDAVYAHIQAAPAVVDAPVVEPAPVATDEAPIAEPDADVIPEKLNQVEALFELSKLAPKSGEAIKSDDPDAIEKLEAKLAYHQARAAMMRDANKNLRRGDDDALYAMGFKDKTIAALKEPDYAGRTGFVDYQMTNNNGEIGRIKKRLKALYKERDANAPEPIAAPVTDTVPASYPPVEYDAGLDDYIAFKDASKKDKWYAKHDNANGHWTVSVDDEYTRGFGDDYPVIVNSAAEVVAKYPAFEGLIQLVNANAQDRERAKVEAAQNTPAPNNEFELNASDLKAYEKGVAAYSSVAHNRYLADIAESKAILDDAGTTYLNESEFQAAINAGTMGGLTEESQKNGVRAHKNDVIGLRDKTVRPSDIVGSGYKDARSAAFTWLATTILQKEASLNGTPSGFHNTVNLSNYSGYLTKLLKDRGNDAPVDDDAKSQTMATVNEFAKTHEGFNGFIGANDEAEAAIAGKPAGEWVTKVEDDQAVTVFMSLGNGKYTGAYNLNIELAYNDIFDKTQSSADRFGTVNELAGVAAKRASKEDLDDLFDTRMDGTGAASKRVLKGKTNKAKTAKGTSIASEFALVDAKFLVASHSATGTKNPKYPQELQPRDRARESSIAWVQKTSKALDPESLGRTSRVDTGAPIVGDDLIVESGNGRTIAIKMAYKNGDAKAYREWLIENARMFGFTEQQIESYKQPVLVRIRTTEVNRAEFAVEANQDDKLSFTASERAKADSKRISGGMLELFAPSANGDINAASNRPFVKQFLASLGATEAAQYTDSNGYPTQALVARIKSAIFSKAYDDDRLLEMMADQTKPDLQNMLNALTMAAPSFVAAQAVNASDAQDLAGQVIDGVEKSINDAVKTAIVDATNMIMSANQNNQDVKEYVLQLGLFDDVDDATAELAVFLASNARSAKKMADYFNAMAKYIEQDSAKRLTLDIFDDPKPISMADVIAYANQQTTTEVNTPMTQDMFAEPAAAPASDDNSALESRLSDFENTVNDADFNPADFDSSAFIALVEATTGNESLTGRIQAISATYQQKLVAASMAAMSALAGGA